MSQPERSSSPGSCSRFPTPPALVLIAATWALSWLAMMIVHEFGHVLHAWLSGAKVVKVVLHPLAISRTDVEPNPRPLFVVWGGPVWGCALPLAVFWASRLLRLPATYLLAFFAGFCLIANGSYIGAGVVYPVGDALDLRRLDTPRWILGLFGIVTVAIGMRLWNGLGKHFGIGADRSPVRWSIALTMTTALVVVIVVEWALSDPA